MSSNEESIVPSSSVIERMTDSRFTTQINERTPLLEDTRGRMVDKNIGISQQTLVTNASESERPRGRRAPQYIAGLSAALGALAAGLVLGWSSSAGKNGIYLARRYNIPITADEFSWIGSLATLGAAAICIPIGIICDLIGRKNAMLSLTVPFMIGWGLIIWSNSVEMFYVGRFITGMSGGAFCVTAPLYTAEIAESEIRGSLGSYFQLMLTSGILVAYILGMVVNDMFWISVISAIVPLIFCAIFFFMPETPIYCLKKGNEEAARASLTRLRGPNYDVESELREQRENLEEIEKNKVPFILAFKTKAAIKALIIGFGLMFFQQLSGVNAIIFYAGSIFSDADMPADISSIIVGVMQVVAVFISTLIVDRLGRRLLLLTSGVAMFITTLTLGVYFNLHNQHVENINWLSLLSICVFIVIFSLGFGPIPWMMMAEIFAPQIKSVAGSSACLFNWLMAFVVTYSYSKMTEKLGNDVTFWIFSVICAVGIVFVFFLVPETKGKTLEQIQAELSGQSTTEQRSNNS